MSREARAILAILAGGAGSRMGQPKALVRIGNRPILEYLLDRIAWPGPIWLITAPGREHPPGWERFDLELVDPVGGLGPLRGVLTALEHSEARETVFSTVDMPGITAAVLGRLIEELHRHPSAPGVMCRREVDSHQQIEPFPLAIRASAAPLVRQRIDSGRRSVRGLVEETGFLCIDAPPHWPQSIWQNLNEPADLRGLADPPTD